MPRTRRPLSETDEPVSTNTATNPTQIGHPTGISTSISTEEIREYFECPICLLVPRPGTPIFACSQGHMVCNVCRPQIRLCPICRIAITEENQQRLYFAERLLEDKVPAECKFSEFGCEVELIGYLLMQHENGKCPFEPVNCDFNHRGCVETVSRAKKFDHVEHCSFRLVDCPIPSCKVQIVKKKLIHHLKEAHGNPDTLMSHRTLMILFLLSVLLNVIFMLVYLGLDQ